MSNKASAWAWDVIKQSGVEAPAFRDSMKLALLSLADNADVNGICWPGHKYTAGRTALAKSTVVSAITTLCDLGVIEKLPTYRSDGSQSSNRYRLDPHGSTFTEGGTDSRYPHAVAQTPHTIGENGGISLNGTHDPSIDPSIDPPKKKNNNGVPLLDQLKEDFKDYYEPGEIERRVEEALSHKSAKKYNDPYLYCRMWLRRDLPKKQYVTSKAQSAKQRPVIAAPEIDPRIYLEEFKRHRGKPY